MSVILVDETKSEVEYLINNSSSIRELEGLSHSIIEWSDKRGDSISEELSDIISLYCTTADEATIQVESYLKKLDNEIRYADLNVQNKIDNAIENIIKIAGPWHDYKL